MEKGIVESAALQSVHWLSCWPMAGWKCMGPYSLRKAKKWKISKESGQQVLVPEGSWDLV